ncbi:MAG: uncharacterized protein A8A55_2672 [Amphiamblys sp. WSBS2006]|nr:MAG: uncharacterized protein A8A55_2672 [Amphiamblys sp. WSBS2006]
MGGERPEEGACKKQRCSSLWRKTTTNWETRGAGTSGKLARPGEQIAQAMKRITEHTKKRLVEETARRYSRGRVEMALQTAQQAQRRQHRLWGRAPNRFVSPKPPRRKRPWKDSSARRSHPR